MTLTELALQLRPLIEKAAQSLPDDEASKGVVLHRGLKGDGSLIKAGTRINFNGILKRAAVDIWDTPENAPDKAPTLWEDVPYKDGFRIIPNVITGGQKFSKGEKGWWGNALKESTLDNNTWTPDTNPEFWIESVK